jgi:hypothetical protein
LPVLASNQSLGFENYSSCRDFLTFHGLSYVIDIYKERIKAEKSWIDYALFVSFFRYWLLVLLKEPHIFFLKLREEKL